MHEVSKSDFNRAVDFKIGIVPETSLDMKIQICIQS